MPIYEYRRPDGSTFEVVQSFSDEPLSTDPETGDPVQRVLHAPAVHFKGKGFYNTDYGTRKRQRENAASSDSSSKDDSSGAKADAPKSELKDTQPATSTSTEKKAADAKPLVAAK